MLRVGSGGQRGVRGKNGKISRWTVPGIYTVINHENPAHMSSDSYGLPEELALRLRLRGRLLVDQDQYRRHLPAPAQHHGVGAGAPQSLARLREPEPHERQVVLPNARIGDVVQVVHSGGPKIQVWQGGDWSVPWSAWTSGTVAS